MQTTGDAHSKYLLDNIGAELLNGKCADIANELADDSITESVVVEVEDVLHNLINEMSRSCSQRPPLFDERKYHPHSCHKGPEQGSTHCT
jgi:hypothetical protein